MSFTLFHQILLYDDVWYYFHLFSPLVKVKLANPILFSSHTVTLQYHVSFNALQPNGFQIRIFACAFMLALLSQIVPTVQGFGMATWMRSAKIPTPTSMSSSRSTWSPTVDLCFEKKLLVLCFVCLHFLRLK